MDPSIGKLLEDDEDETKHSGVDVEAFQAALNRDIGGDASSSQLSGSDAALSQGSNNTFSQSIPQWPTPSHDNQTGGQNQEPKTAQQQDQPSSEVEPKQHGSFGEQLQHVASQDLKNPPLPHHVASQDINNPPFPQKQSQDEAHQSQAVQVPLHNSQTMGIHNLGKDPVINNEVVKTHNPIPSSESQYAKSQQMSNQQATVTEQASSQINHRKQVPFGLLLPILIPQLPKDRAMQLQTLFTKLKKDEIPKDSFLRHMKSIVGDQMLSLALTRVQEAQTRTNPGHAGQQHPVRMPTVSSGARQFNDPHALAQLHQRSMNAAADQSRMTSSAVPSMENSARKSQELDVRIENQGLQPSQLPSSNSNILNQEAERSSIHIQGIKKQQHQHLHFPSAFGSSGASKLELTYLDEVKARAAEQKRLKWEARKKEKATSFSTESDSPAAKRLKAGGRDISEVENLPSPQTELGFILEEPVKKTKTDYGKKTSSSLELPINLVALYGNILDGEFKYAEFFRDILPVSEYRGKMDGFVVADHMRKAKKNLLLAAAVLGLGEEAAFDLGQSQSKMDQVLLERNEARKERDEAADKVKSLDDQLVTACSSLFKVEGELAKEKQQVNLLRSQLDSVTKEAFNLRQDKLALEKEKSVASSEVRHLRGEVSRLQKGLEVVVEESATNIISQIKVVAPDIDLRDVHHLNSVVDGRIVLHEASLEEDHVAVQTPEITSSVTQVALSSAGVAPLSPKT